jgi:hypothetical protein
MAVGVAEPTGKPASERPIRFIQRAPRGSSRWRLGPRWYYLCNNNFCFLSDARREKLIPSRLADDFFCFSLVFSQMRK